MVRVVRCLSSTAERQHQDSWNLGQINMVSKSRPMYPNYFPFGKPNILPPTWDIQTLSKVQEDDQTERCRNSKWQRNLLYDIIAYSVCRLCASAADWRKALAPLITTICRHMLKCRPIWALCHQLTHFPAWKHNTRGLMVTEVVVEP